MDVFISQGIVSGMAKLSEILKERGYVHQHSSESLEELTDGAKRTVYLGIDPSADSLHVGNLQAMLVLRRHPEAGGVLRALDEWLHRPTGMTPQTDLNALLAPYRDVPAEEGA